MVKRGSLWEFAVDTDEEHMFLALGLVEYGESFNIVGMEEEKQFESRALFSAEYVDGVTIIELFWSIQFVVGKFN